MSDQNTPPSSASEHEITGMYDAASYVSSFLPDKSVHQMDARIFHRGGFEYDYLKAFKSARVEGNAVVLETELTSGATAELRVIVLSSEAVRLQFAEAGSGAVFEETSDMLVPYSGDGAAPALKEYERGFKIAFGDKEMTLSNDPAHMQIKDSSGKLVFQLEKYDLAGPPLVGPLGLRRAGGAAEPFLSWHIHNEEKHFGLGEKWNKVEKTSTRATVWNVDTCGSNSNDLSYKALPYILSTRGWGMFLHSSFRSFWEIGTFSYISGSFLTEDNKIDAFLFFGDTLKELIGGYTALTGRPQMPPRWALGVWMSRCQYRSKTEVDEVLQRLRAEKIPCDVIHLDPLWMAKHYYFKIGVDACDFVKNEKDFPDLPGLWKRWLKDGFNTCLWVNPYLPEGTEIYEHAKARGYLLKSLNGGLARLSHGEPVGMVDFTNPEAREWWKGKLKEVLNEGASVIKPDYGDRIPEDALFHNGKTGRELHNMYLFWYTEAAFQAAQEAHGFNIVWRRPGYIGSQRYPGTWSGDTRVSWEEMRACLRGGLSESFCGNGFWTHDVAGFTGPVPTEELYCRWAQMGLLSPLTRFHGNSPREPWHYGETAMKVVKRYARLRYSLIPYIEACAQENCDTGVPILRHMYLEFPNEPGTEHLDDQYMLGGELLVAPVFEPNRRSRPVYFPEGEWVHLEDADADPATAKVYAGGRFHEVEAPLEMLPLFRRKNAKIPRDFSNRQHLKD